MWTHRTVWYWLQADIIWRTVRLETRKVPTGCHSELTDDIEEFRENLHIQVSSVSYVRMRKPKELWSNQNFTRFSSRVLMIMSQVSKSSLNECLSECALHLGRNMSTKMDFTSEFLIQAHQSVLYHSKQDKLKNFSTEWIDLLGLTRPEVWDGMWCAGVYVISTTESQTQKSSLFPGGPPTGAFVPCPVTYQACGLCTWKQWKVKENWVPRTHQTTTPTHQKLL